jgi:cell division topological specificity factor
MLDIIKRIRTVFLGPQTYSKNDAKQRLKFLLIHDQVDLSPGQLDRMKEEIMEVVNRYVDVDNDGVEFRLDRHEGHVSLVSNVPVRRVTGIVA